MTDDVSVDERRAIEWDCSRLIALYANLNDEARWDDLADLYVPDGMMSRPTASDVLILGRDNIKAAFAARAPRKTRHVCSNIVIDVISRSVARGTSAMVLFTANDASVVGSFHGRFVLTGQGWKFAERRGSVAFP